MSEKVIIGAGLAGLITACRIKDANIYEAGVRNENHKALLRFRDKSVSELTGIPFREVTVHKSIFYSGVLYERCNSAMANFYSRKVVGSYGDRSIWDLDDVKRYIAPEDLYDQLVDAHGDRIAWNTKLMASDIKRGNTRKVINTAPLPIMMKICGLATASLNFDRSTIIVDRYRLPQGSDVYQTIYFADPGARVFRASITGDLLIVESVCESPRDQFEWDTTKEAELDVVLSAFGVQCEIDKLESVEQKYGKIIDLPRMQREAILYELTRDFNVFSIGRFATWRNILLDHVVKDISVVERLLAASDYGRELVLANR
jgi:hypothetical protein